MKLLAFSPIVLALSTYMAVVYGYLYLLFTTITEVYESQYHFSQGSVGLTYLGIGVGSLCGVIIFGVASDKIVKNLTKRNGGGMKAEYRLPPMIPGSLVIPIGCEPQPSLTFPRGLLSCCSIPLWLDSRQARLLDRSHPRHWFVHPISSPSITCSHLTTKSFFAFLTNVSKPTASLRPTLQSHIMLTEI